MTQLTPNVILVDVPEKFWCFHVNKDGDIISYPEDGGGGTKSIGHYILKQDLPPGQWRILSLLYEMTEEKWLEIMPFVSGWSKPIYYDYTANGRDYRDIADAAFDTAAESGLSLLSSLGITDTKNKLVLVK